MKPYTLTPKTLKSLAQLNQFQIPKNELVLFALRFAWPAEPHLKPQFKKSHELVLFTEKEMEARIFKLLSCTIGQWDTGKDEIAIFPGSTVPNWNSNLKKYIEKGRPKANTLLPGYYPYQLHLHNCKYRAFGLEKRKVQPIHRFKVQHKDGQNRPKRIGGYDGKNDIIQVMNPSDNIHASSCDARTRTKNDNLIYFSAGCPTVAGWGLSFVWKEKLGNRWSKYEPYKTFVENGWVRSAQAKFQFMLLNGSEAHTVATAPESATGQLQFGSRDHKKDGKNGLVHQLQRKLKLSRDGVFGKKTFLELRKKQNQLDLLPDGILGPETAKLLKLKLPKLK